MLTKPCNFQTVNLHSRNLHPWIAYGSIPANSNKATYCSPYAPPNLPVLEHTHISKYLISCVDDHLGGNPCDSIIIAGDINDLDVKLFTIELGLDSLLKFATRRLSTVDNIFASKNASHLFTRVTILPPLQTSDHCIVLATAIAISLHKHTIKPMKLYDLRDSKVEDFYTYLNNNHDQLTGYLANHCNNDSNLMVKAFLMTTSNRLLIVFLHAQFMLILPNLGLLHLSLTYHPLTIDLINKRWAAFRIGDFIIFNYYKQKIKSAIHAVKTHQIHNWSSKTKSVWSVIHQLKPCMNKNNILGLIPNFNNDLDLATQLNSQFYNNFSKESLTTQTSDSILQLPIDNAVTPLFDCVTIHNALMRLKPRKSAGIDSFNEKFIKLAALFITEPLALIFNNILLQLLP